ncbi:hypothetical protein XANCAGTX0491_009955 [Xanthoria calcicola]
MADSTPKSYHTDPTLYLYTSLTAGSSHITTATSRLETILKANRIPFQALDVATDEKARMLWGRRAGKRKLPGLVRMGMLVGDLSEIEEWNEYGELKDHLGGSLDPTPSTPSAANTPSKKTPATTSTSTPSKLLSTISTPPKHSSASNPMAAAMRQAGAEAAKKAGDAKTMKGKASTSMSTSTAPASTTVTPTTKPASENAAATAAGDGADEEKAGEDPDSEAVVAGSKDTIDVKGETARDPDPDAEAVVPGSKDIINDHEDGIKREDEEPKKPDEEEKHKDPKPTSAPPTTTTPPAKKNPPQPTHHDSDSDSDSEPGNQPPPTRQKNDTAATDKGQDLPGTKTQAQTAAKAEDAGTSVGD